MSIDLPSAARISSASKPPEGGSSAAPSGISAEKECDRVLGVYEGAAAGARGSAPGASPELDRTTAGRGSAATAAEVLRGGEGRGLTGLFAPRAGLVPREGAALVLP